MAELRMSTHDGCGQGTTMEMHMHMRTMRGWGWGVLGLAGLLSACGGGGSSNTRPDPPPASVAPPTPPVVYPANPNFSQHLVQTNAAPAQQAGLTGAGIRIGVLDSGVNRNHPALQGRVTNLTYVSSPPNNLAIDDVDGHGTAVAQTIAGKPFGEWPGGIAPGAQIVSARIISDEPPADDGSGQGNEVSGAIGLKGIHQDLIARGVKIMNNSWGGLYWTNLSATAPIADEYRPFVIGNGGLVVFAAGNESRANPSSVAALPSQPGIGGSLPGADLERGWLTVAALDQDNPTALATYSNACGVAMHYCLVAPGSVVVTGTNDAPSNPTYWRWTGTSFAAPLVSGAAALVWQAFPYFDNNLIRQTLLGTASDLGTPGVDATFGYGALDIGRAVQGPAQLDWGTVTARFDGISSTWGNRIVGNGGITKQGTGTLLLAGDNAYTGATRVEGGTLRPSFGTPGDAFVGTLGRLELHNARVGGSLDNLGTTVVTGGAGHAIAGDFHQGAGARLAMEIGARINVAGQARIDGGELQVIGRVSGYVHTAEELLLQAVGGVAGTFSTLGQGPGVFLDASLRYDPTRVLLDIRRLDITAAATSMGFTGASLAGAERLEGAFDAIDEGALPEDEGVTVDGDFLGYAGAIQRSATATAAERTLASLSGELHGTDSTQALMSIDGNRHALESRIDALPATGAWSDRIGAQRAWQGMGIDANGWVLGQDQRLGNGLVVGSAFSEVRGQAWLGERNDREHNRQVEGQLYAAWEAGPAYVLGRIAEGRMERRTQRDILLGDSAFDVGVDTVNRYQTAALQSGWRFGGLTPYLGVQATGLMREGFNETGAAGFGLSTQASEMDATQALLGARFGRQWRIGATGLGLHGRFEWQRTLAQTGADIDARFSGLDVWSPIHGDWLDRDAFVAGLGLDARFAGGSVLGLGLDARDDGNRRLARAWLRWAIGF